MPEPADDLERNILVLLADMSFLVSALGRRSPGGIIVAAARMSRHTENILAWARLRELEEKLQEELPLDPTRGPA